MGNEDKIMEGGGVDSKERTARGLSRMTKKELQAELKERECELADALNRLSALLKEKESQDAELRSQEEERLRLLAEMDNVRKRTQRRLEDERRYVVSDILRPFLEVADNMERALQSAEKGETCSALAQGVEMVYKQMTDVFAQHGVTIIETDGKSFDYNLHEAVGKMPVPGKDENEIVAEIARGYLLNDKLLRPSRVIVASGEAPADET